MKNNSDSWGIWEQNGPVTVKDRVRQAIADRIAAGDLKPGDSLPAEPDLCRDMGVSRVAVREAVKQLEVLGFVRIIRGIGTVIRTLDFNCLAPVIESLGKGRAFAFKDLHGLRILVEVEAAGLTAVKHDADLITRLRKTVGDMEVHMEEEKGYVEMDFLFHKEILKACPNPLFNYILESFDTYLRRSRELSFAGTGGAQRALDMHRRILDAVADGDAAAARALMHRHLEETAEDLGLS